MQSNAGMDNRQRDVVLRPQHFGSAGLTASIHGSLQGVTSFDYTSERRNQSARFQKGVTSFDRISMLPKLEATQHDNHQSHSAWDTKHLQPTTKATGPRLGTSTVRHPSTELPSAWALHRATHYAFAPYTQSRLLTVRPVADTKHITAFLPQLTLLHDIRDFK